MYNLINILLLRPGHNSHSLHLSHFIALTLALRSRGNNRYRMLRIANGFIGTD